METYFHEKLMEQSAKQSGVRAASTAAIAVSCQLIVKLFFDVTKLIANALHCMSVAFLQRWERMTCKIELTAGRLVYPIALFQVV